MNSLDDDLITADSFADHLTRQHRELARNKPLRDTAGQYPLMVTIRVQHESIEDDPAGVIGAWISAWEHELGAPIDVPVLPVLYIGYTGKDPGFFSSFFSKPPRDRIEAAAQSALAAAPGQYFDATLAPQLGTIDWSVANDWMRDHFSGDLRDMVDDLVTELFPEKGESPAYNMSEFYNMIKNKPPFTGEQRA